MKRSKFTEEQIIGILREQGRRIRRRCEDGGAVPQARDQQRDVLRLEGQVRRDGSVRREAAEGSRRRECPAEAALGGVAARPGRAEGPPVAKVVTPAARREAVAILVERHEMSERRACAVIGADRTSIRYRSRRPDDHDLRERLRALARTAPVRLPAAARSAEAGGPCREPQENPAALPRGGGRRMRRPVRKRWGRKKTTGTRAPLLTVATPNARWSVDFVHDQFAQGRRLRIFNVIDDVTKECLAAVVDTSISGRRVARELAALIARRGRPGLIVSDHGTEFTSNAMLAWTEAAGVAWHFIAPGKPMRDTGSARPSIPRCGTNS